MQKPRKTIKRAVLQFRVHHDEYQELANEAAKRELTISEEAARRLRAYQQQHSDDKPPVWGW